MDYDNEFGTQDERKAALNVAKACQDLNRAIFNAAHVGVNVRVIDLTEDWDEHSNLQVKRMERRTMILPASEIAVRGGD